MQKWEYIVVIRNRGYEYSKENKCYEGTKWGMWIWNRGDIQGKKWDGNNLADLLCELGDDGWELVSYTPRSDRLGGMRTAGAIDFAGFTDTELLTFKRPKE